MSIPLRGQPESPIAMTQTPVVFRWDLDKTYLLTDFESLRELVKIPFEKAKDKRAAPGVTALMRGIRTVARQQGREVRVYFLSASPPQIGKEIRKKLELDGIEYDGIVFKDQLHRLIRGKFRHLREQVGYKLTELLKERVGGGLSGREYLFGDDWESDPLIYSLYADVLTRRLDTSDLRDLLERLRVDPPLVDEACLLADKVPDAEGVARIFINLERRTPPGKLRIYGGRLIPTYNYFQTAACLFADGLLDEVAVGAVADSLLLESSYTASRLVNSLADLVRRGHLDSAHRDRLAAVVRGEHGVAHEKLSVAHRLRGWWRRWNSPPVVRSIDPPPKIDYRLLVAHSTADEASQA